MMIEIFCKKGTELAEEVKGLIRSRELGKKVKITITDNGPEIPVLKAISGEYRGVQKITSYLKGFFV